MADTVSEHDATVSQVLAQARVPVEDDDTLDETSTALQTLLDEPGTSRNRGGRRGGRRGRGAGKKGGGLPKHVSRLMGEANMAYVNREFGKAIPLLIQVIQESANINPAPSDPYHTMGLIYEELGHTETSFQFYFLAASIQKKDYDLWRRLGIMAYSLGHYDRAIECFTKVLRRDPDDLNTLWDRSFVYSEKGEYGKAAQGYNTLLENGRNDEHVIRELAKAWHHTKRTQAAIDLLVENNVGSDLNSVNILLEMYIHLKQYETAVQYMNEKMFAEDPDRQLPVDIHVNYGICLVHLGKLDEAQHQLDKLLDIGDNELNDYAETFDHVAGVLLDYRDLTTRGHTPLFTHAEPFLQRVHNFYQAHSISAPQTLWKLARCHKYKGDLDMAIFYCLEMQASPLDPAMDKEVKLMLAELYERTGDTQKALEAVRGVAGAGSGLATTTTTTTTTTSSGGAIGPGSTARASSSVGVDPSSSTALAVGTALAGTSSASATGGKDLRAMVVEARLLYNKGQKETFVNMIYHEMQKALNALVILNPKRESKNKRIPYPEWGTRRLRKRKRSGLSRAEKIKKSKDKAATTSATPVAAATAEPEDDEDAFMRQADDGDSSASDDDSKFTDPSRMDEDGDTNTTTTTTATPTSTTTTVWDRDDNNILHYCTCGEFFDLLERLTIALSEDNQDQRAFQLVNRITALLKWGDDAREKRALQLIATTAFNCHKYGEAFVTIKKVCTMDPESIPAWGLLARIMNSSADEKQMYSAHRFAIRALQRTPSSLPIQLTVAHSSVLTTSHALALGLYFEALSSLQGDSPLILLCIGLTYLNLIMKKSTRDRHYAHLQSVAFLQSYAAAMTTSLRNALQRPEITHPEALYNLGRAYHELRLEHLAIPYYEAVLQYDDGLSTQLAQHGVSLVTLRISAAYNMALIFGQRGEHDKARTYIFQYIEV